MTPLCALMLATLTAGLLHLVLTGRNTPSRLALPSILLFGALCLLPGVAAAETSEKPLHWSWLQGNVVLTLHGQYRPRFELMQRRDMRPADPANGVLPDVYFVTHRARLGASVQLWKQLTAFFQLQDVRRWGSETDTLGDFQADGFDLHQGWIAWRPWQPLCIQVGRMELIYDGHRLIGNVGWLQQARSFDAIRVKLQGSWVEGHITAAKLSDSGDPATEQLLGLAWLRFTRWRFWQPSLYYILHHQPQKNQELRHTFGALMRGSIAGFRYTGELYFQLGSNQNEGQSREILAWMSAVELAYTWKVKTKPTLRAWAEFVSGSGNDPNDGVDRSFDTLFATNHKFYGFVDMFLNLPVHTGRRGLMDLGIGFALRPVKQLLVRFDAHYFRLMSPLSGADGEAQELGPEFDLILAYTIIPRHFSVSGGYGVVIPIGGQAFAALGKGSAAEHWAFLQLDVKL